MPNLPEGSGSIVSQFGAIPPAGSEVTAVVPLHTRWLLLSIGAGLSCSATVANRLPYVYIIVDGTAIAYIPSNTTQTAGSQVNYYWLNGLGAQLSAGTEIHALPLPTGLLLPRDSLIKVSAIDLQPTDQFGSMNIMAVEWIEP